MTALVPAEVVRAWLVASCEAQGVAVVVADPKVLASVAVLVSGRGAGVGGATRGPLAGAGRARPAPLPDSDSPDRFHSGWVQALGSKDSGGDDGMVQDCSDHGVLTVEVEVAPLRGEVVAGVEPLEGVAAGGSGESSLGVA